MKKTINQNIDELQNLPPQAELEKAFYEGKPVKFVLAKDKKAGNIYAMGFVDKQFVKDKDGKTIEKYIIV